MAFLLSGHKAEVLCVATDPLAPQIIASGSEDSTVRLWDLRAAKATRCIRSAFSEQPVTSVAWSRSCSGTEGSSTLYAAAGSSVHAFDLRVDGIVLSTATQSCSFNTDEINQIDVHADTYGSDVIAAADDSGAVCVISGLATSDCEPSLMKVLRKHTMFAYTVAFRPGHIRGLELVSGGFDCMMYNWNVTKGKHRYSVHLGSSGLTDDAPTTATVNPPYVHSLCYSDDGSVVAAGLGDGSVSLHDAISQDCVARVWPHKKAVGHVEFAAFAPADACNRVLASSSNDGSVLVLDIAQDACRTPSKASKTTKKGRGRVAAAASEATEPWRVLYRIDHGAGPNWMSTSTANGGAVIVADTTPHITVYSGVCEGVHTRFTLEDAAGLRVEAVASADAGSK